MTLRNIKISEKVIEHYLTERNRHSTVYDSAMEFEEIDLDLDDDH